MMETTTSEATECTIFKCKGDCEFVYEELIYSLITVNFTEILDNHNISITGKNTNFTITNGSDKLISINVSLLVVLLFLLYSHNAVWH